MCAAALHPAVPSRRLLRFLRFQSQGIPYFNHGQRQPCNQTRRLTGTTSSSSSTISNSSARVAHPSSSSLRRLSTCKLNKTTSKPLAFDVDNVLPPHLKRVRALGGAPLLAANSLVSSRRNKSSSEDGCDSDNNNNDSNSEEKSVSQRLWGPNAVRPDFRSRSTDELEESIYSNSVTGRRAKAALEPVLRCTEVDEKGDAILTDGAFKKSELIAKYGLMVRDLRKIDSSNLPHILIRPSAILLNLLHLRVLIKHDRVLLFDVYGSSSSSAQSEFMYELQGKLRQKQSPGTSSGLPYEFRALEVVLMSVTSELWKDFHTVEDPVMHLLAELEEDVDREKLRMLLMLSKKVSTFEQKARLVRNALEELLDADDDLSQMYLTEKTRDIKREQDDHTEIEMLLESYHKICDEVVQEAGNLVSGIRNTEEIIRAILDANRNALMLLELKLSVYTLGIAVGTFVAGLYGMNLENFIEETNWGFSAVTGGSCFAIVLAGWYGFVKLRKVQRVRMSQPAKHSRKAKPYELGDGMQSRGGLAQREWYHDDSPTALLQAKQKERLKRIAMMKERQAEMRWYRKWWERFR